MIWRIGGMITVPYVGVQLVLMLWWVTDPEMRADAVRGIDWNFVPEHLRLALEFSCFRIPQILTLFATIPAVPAFYARARGRRGRWWFLTYLVGCLIGLVLQLAIDYQIGTAGPIPTGRGGGQIHHFNVVEELFLVMLMSLPLVYYLIAELVTRIGEEKPGF